MMLFATCKACEKTITDPFSLMTAEHFPWECPCCGGENPPLRMRNDVQVVEVEDLGENVAIPGAISLSLQKDTEAEAASSGEAAASTETRGVEEVAIPGAISLSLRKDTEAETASSGEAEAASSGESAASTETRGVEEVEEQEIEIRDHISEDSRGFKL